MLTIPRTFQARTEVDQCINWRNLQCWNTEELVESRNWLDLNLFPPFDTYLNVLLAFFYLTHHLYSFVPFFLTFSFVFLRRQRFPYQQRIYVNQEHRGRMCAYRIYAPCPNHRLHFNAAIIYIRVCYVCECFMKVFNGCVCVISMNSMDWSFQRWMFGESVGR